MIRYHISMYLNFNQILSEISKFEKENGKTTATRKIKHKIPVTEYLNKQKRYRHLFDSERGQEEIEKIQAIADMNIEKYGLLPV